MTMRLSILGSTGSVGRSALAVVDYANSVSDEPAFEIEALTAFRDAERLAKQAISFDAKIAVIGDEGAYAELRERLAGTGIEAACGAKAISEAAERPVDRVLAAIVGIAGLESTHAALTVGNSVALANKESMVCAGPLLKQIALKSGAAIVPTDSEHNAMFQVMERAEDVETLILTASGGPFLNTPKARLSSVTPDEACAHPQWSMGRKISVDSATFMNKGLELIEAAYLFDMPEDRIDVLVHPQSIIHSLVSYRDGSVLAQLGLPDMQTPISHALSWPKRRQPTNVRRLNLPEIGRLDFQPVDPDRFPAIGLARAALREGPAATIVLNCANEVAVAAFLEGKCQFTDISWIVERALQHGLATAKSPAEQSLGDVIELDRRGRHLCEELVAHAAGQARSRAQ